MNRYVVSALALVPVLTLGCVGAISPGAPNAVANARRTPPPAPKEAPLTIDQELDNLVAYTKLLGYVRYFHPSDEAAAADWENLAVSGVPRVEQARSPEELAAALQSVFAGVAPTVRVYPSGHPAAPPAELAPPAGVAQATYVAWVHHGLGAAFGASAGGGVYTSVRVTNVRTPHTGTPGDILHRLDAGLVRGKTVRVKASVRAELTDPHATARLALAAWPNGDRVVRGTSEPITSHDWSEVEVVGTVDPKDDRVYVDLRLEGDGKAWIDDVTVTVEGARAPLALDDAGFEASKPGVMPPAWDGDDGTGEYHAFASDVRPHGGTRCGELDAKPLPLEQLPKPADVFRAPLGGGVEAMVPLALYQDGNGRTVPVSALVPQPSSEPAEKRMARYSARDRMVRVADVALVWNLFEHFDPYMDGAKIDWPGALRRALARAIADTDAKTFHTTLQHLTAVAHDSHTGVWREATELDPTSLRKALPLSWRVIEGKVVVTAVRKDARDVRVGDVVVALDGRPAEQALADAEARVSASSPQYLAQTAAERLAYGPADGEVTLRVSRGGGAPIDVKVAYSADEGPPEARPENGAEVAPGVVYFDLTRGTEAVANAELEHLLPKLAAARAVLFDLRGYPAVAHDFLEHLSDQTLHTAPFLVPKIERPDRDHVDYSTSAGWSVPPTAPRFKGKVAFLTDERAVSYGETLMGFIDAYKLGAIVGSPTAGENGNRNDVLLPGGFGVSFTGMKVTKHDGSPLHGVGYAPTVPCAPTIAGVAAGKDEVLACGVAAVK